MTRGLAERATVRLAARAKINLRLQVLAREASTYHQIETVFCALELADDVEIALGGEALRFEVESPDGIHVPSNSENLAYRAAERFFSAAKLKPGATIRLRKRIPVGAGLGGGSSDAASTLKGLNLLSREPLSEAQLIELGADLGADVPFFLCGSSLALGWGRGQRLLPLTPLPPMAVLLAVPPFPIETRLAYQALSIGNNVAGGRAHVLHPQRLNSWEAVQQDAVNDFETALFPKHALLPQLRDALREAGASSAMLSGSGSTIFGLFALDRAAARAAKRIREQFPAVRTIETRTVAWTAQ
ncbi:MAG: 4-(cytidine 5'-diphospho)-2-C-methyl-D-erythritol kinase [Gemmatimonadota bacterium]